MNNKLTFSFDKEVIAKAEKFAAQNNMSLSRFIEYLLNKVVENQYQSIEDFPIADWVSKVSEGDAVYKTKKSKATLDKDFFESKK